MSDEYGQNRLDPSFDEAQVKARSDEIARQAIEAGAKLRQLRESASVDLMLLASTLKVTPQKIEALEDGRFQDLPDMTFARGLAAAVCRAFGQDPAPVLALMPVVARGLQQQVTEGSEPRQPSTPVTFHTGGGRLALSRWFASVPRGLLAVVTVLLVGALVVWFLPGRYVHSGDTSLQTVGEAKQASAVASAASDADSDAVAGSASDAASAAASDAAFAPASNVASAPDLAVVASPAAPASAAASRAGPGASAASASSVPSALTAASPAVPASAAASRSSRSGASAAPASQAAASAASTPASAARHGSGIVEQNVVAFSAIDQTWVGVTDGNGKRILSRNLNGGDNVSIGGELPLVVTVGNRNAVIVTVRGVPVDLDKYVRGSGTVSRFTVDPIHSPHD